MNTLIVTGGSIEQDFLEENIKKNKYENIIAVDKGLESLDKLDIRPTYIIGDFDSINHIILKKYEDNIIELNKEKDYTDTHMALRLAIEKGATCITIIGGIGSRIDHTMANIHILKEALDKNIPSKIINKNNEIFLTNKKIILNKKEGYKYISLLPLTEECEGITLEGLKYTLQNATLTIGKSIGISNEQITDNAVITIERGILIVIYSKD